MLFNQKRLSISQKITFMYSVILSGILLAFGIMSVLATGYLSMRDVEGELISNATAVEDFVKSINDFGQDSFINLKLGYSVFYSIFDENKKLLYTNKPDLPLLEITSDDKVQVYNEKDFRHDSAITYTNRKITINGKLYYIQVAKSSEYYLQLIQVLGRTLIFTGILGVIICVISGRHLSKSMLKPIRNISNIAKEITAVSLDKRIPVDGPDDELKDLAGIFNSMIERLEADFEKQRRFTSDASHELRTPLAVIHGYIDMLNRWGKNDAEILSRSLESLMSETERMGKLIENLLYLAKNDSDTLLLKPEKFPLDTLFKEVVDEAVLIRSEYSVMYNCESDHLLTADYNAIKQVLRNLIDNSMKYSTPPGEIELKAGKIKGGTRITVSDKGIGIPPESLPFIFDRFYRVDESRTKTTGGSGLGLSIAMHIVKSHNGTISVKSKPGEGTIIEIYLPQFSYTLT
jgi:two-component system, OmpR family, sensor histidine kinase ArlS